MFSASGAFGHQAICLEGGTMPDERAFLARAVELAKQTREVTSTRIETKMVNPSELIVEGPVRVDLGTGRLVADAGPGLPLLS